MATVKDYFVHNGERLDAVVAVEHDETPINTSTHTVHFAVAKELTTNTLATLSSANTSQIELINANTATYTVKYTPTADYDLVYQLKTVDSSNVTVVVQYGRIFVTPSLFD